MITYSWKIKKAEVIENEDNLTDVIKNIAFTVKAEENKISVSHDHLIILSKPNANDFIVYDELTESRLVEWVQASVNTVAIEAELASQLEIEKRGKAVEKDLPWE